MAVKIRLKRMGKKKQPTYRVVVADSRSPRDGRIIEAIGRYDPRQEPSIVEIDNERATYWLGNGAQPTERAQKLLEISGAVAPSKVSRSGVYRLDEEDAKVEDVEASAVPEAPSADEPAAEEDPTLSEATELEATESEATELKATEPDSTEPEAIESEAVEAEETSAGGEAEDTDA